MKGATDLIEGDIKPNPIPSLSEENAIEKRSGSVRDRRGLWISRDVPYEYHDSSKYLQKSFKNKWNLAIANTMLFAINRCPLFTIQKNILYGFTIISIIPRIRVHY